MGPRDIMTEHEHFSKATVLTVAISIDLAAIFIALLWIGMSVLVSSLVVAAAAIMTGLLIRKIAGRRAMWLCFGLAVLAIIVGALLQSSTMTFT